MGIKTTILHREDPRIIPIQATLALHNSILTSAIDARRVIGLTNTMPQLTEAEAQEWINTFFINSANRNVINLLNRYLIGDTFLHFNDAMAQSASSVFTTVRSIRIDSIFPTPTTIRVYFEGASHLTGNVFRLLRNTTVAANFNVTTPTVWTEYGTDVLNCTISDTFHLQIQSDGIANSGVRNFRIRGSAVPISTLREAINIRSSGVLITFTNTL